MRAPVHPVESAAAPPRGYAAPPGWSPFASNGAVAATQYFLQSGPGAQKAKAEARADVLARSRAMAWVSRLPTRTGTDRGERIRYCGWMEVCYQPGTGSVGWRQRFCKDRACPVCARNRASKARHQMRAHLAAREQAGCGPLAFLTLTHPKFSCVAEGPGEAVDRLMAEWRKLRDRRPFRRHVAGYVRAVECVWSRKGWKRTKDGRPFYTRETGWHAHLHIILELEPMSANEAWDVQAWLTSAWVEITGGSEKGISWQALSRAKVGQIAKYITKPFELPVAQAPLFFQELAGRRLLQGGGTWRYYQQADAGDGGEAPAGWVPQALHVADLIDRMPRRDEHGKPAKVVFSWVVDGDGEVRSGVYRPALKSEVARSIEMEAWRAVDLLVKDARPIAERGRGDP